MGLVNFISIHNLEGETERLDREWKVDRFRDLCMVWDRIKDQYPYAWHDPAIDNHTGLNTLTPSILIRHLTQITGIAGWRVDFDQCRGIFDVSSPPRKMLTNNGVELV